MTNQGSEVLTERRVWFITGAGRGIGVDIAKAALAGNAVVATRRNTGKAIRVLGEDEDRLDVKLDITDVAQAEAAARAAVERFRQVDVIVNNTGNVYAGYFEEISPAQIETSPFRSKNFTRQVLPVMRRRSGLVVTISSTPGIIGQEFCTAYAAPKFDLEGWIDSLAPEIAPFGIRTMLEEPGFFRIELLTSESTSYADSSIEDLSCESSEPQDGGCDDEFGAVIRCAFGVAGGEVPELLSRLKQRSTTFRRLYSSASKAGGRPPLLPLALRRDFWSERSGLVKRILRFRRAALVEGWE